MKVNVTAARSVHAKAQQKKREKALLGNRTAPRCALVTGASQGLGRAFADECAVRGMDLFLVALPESGLPQVAQRIGIEQQRDLDHFADVRLVFDVQDPVAAHPASPEFSVRGIRSAHASFQKILRLHRCTRS